MKSALLSSASGPSLLEYTGVVTRAKQLKANRTPRNGPEASIRCSRHAPAAAVNAACRGWERMFAQDEGPGPAEPPPLLGSRRGLTPTGSTFVETFIGTSLVRLPQRPEGRSRQVSPGMVAVAGWATGPGTGRYAALRARLRGYSGGYGRGRAAHVSTRLPPARWNLRPRLVPRMALPLRMDIPPHESISYSQLQKQEAPALLPEPPATGSLLDVMPYIGELALGEKSLNWRVAAALTLLFISKGAGGCDGHSHLWRGVVMAIVAYGLCDIIKHVAKELQMPVFTPVSQLTTEARKKVVNLENQTSSKTVDALLNYETVALFNNQRLEVGQYDWNLRCAWAYDLNSGVRVMWGIRLETQGALSGQYDLELGCGLRSGVAVRWKPPWCELSGQYEWNLRASVSGQYDWNLRGECEWAVRLEPRGESEWAVRVEPQGECESAQFDGNLRVIGVSGQVRWNSGVGVSGQFRLGTSVSVTVAYNWNLRVSVSGQYDWNLRASVSGQYDWNLGALQKAFINIERLSATMNAGQSTILAMGLAGVMVTAVKTSTRKFDKIGRSTASNHVSSIKDGPISAIPGIPQDVADQNSSHLSQPEQSIANHKVENGSIHETMHHRADNVSSNSSSSRSSNADEASTSALSAYRKGGLRAELQDIKFGYNTERQILKGVSMTIEPGTSIALVGSSGSGKSTMLRMLTRMFDASSGKVLLNGVDVKDLSKEAIAVVPQETVLFNDTIMENIRYGRPSATDDDVMVAAGMAKLHDAVLRMTDGYATTVGERGLKLSGGEKQRVAIARAFLRSPRLLICDEATSALDSETEVQIMSSLTELAEGRTSVFVAHRLSTIKNCDIIFVLSAGRVVESGSHAALLETPGGMYRGMWELQLTEEATGPYAAVGSNLLTSDDSDSDSN
eukprot:gene23171-30381_t